MIQISEKANPNYLCKVVQLKGLSKHFNADRLQTVLIDFQTVITGMNAKEGDIYVYFPVESCISPSFLSFSNSFKEEGLNSDPTETGFFERNCRVKAMRLRGEKSMGYIVPASLIAEWANVPEYRISSMVDQEFDTVNDMLLVKKYEVKTKTQNCGDKNGKKPQLSRIIEGQIHLHVDTENLRKNVHLVNPPDDISITYKTHGTSWWVSNVLVKRFLPLKDRIAKWFGVKVVEEEYDLVYGSRRVVKNLELGDPKAKEHYYKYDLWGEIKKEIGHLIPKGYTFYGEMIGYDHNGRFIQDGYDYGCRPKEHKLEVYRITKTNPDGFVTEFTHKEISEMCNKLGLNASVSFYRGRAVDLFNVESSEPISTDTWREKFVEFLEQNYNEKDCFLCVNKVPEEGIVLRRESLFDFQAYKLKSFRFLEAETKQLDSGKEDLESQN
jgi:hypothetical protein